MSTNRPQFAEQDFQKATRSEPDKACVRVARRGDWVELRDDKTTFGATDDRRLVFSAEEFDAFLAEVRAGGEAGYLGAVRAGESGDMCLEIVNSSEDYTFRRSGGSIELDFTEVEVAAFIHGVVRGEFDQDTVRTEVVAV